MAEGVRSVAERIVRKLTEGTPVELVDVEYVKERDWYLRVFIDKPGGVMIDDCQELSERLAPLLDREDAIKEGYILEVSSPGLDRPLKKPRDFERAMGKVVDVSLYEPVDGKKLITGVLQGFDGESVTVEGVQVKNVAAVRLHVEI